MLGTQAMSGNEWPKNIRQKRSGRKARPPKWFHDILADTLAKKNVLGGSRLNQKAWLAHTQAFVFSVSPTGALFYAVSYMDRCL